MVFREVENPDKKLTLYPTLCHELHNKQGWEKVLGDYVGWVNKILAEIAAKS